MNYITTTIMFIFSGIRFLSFLKHYTLTNMSKTEVFVRTENID